MPLSKVPYSARPPISEPHSRGGIGWYCALGVLEVLGGVVLGVLVILGVLGVLGLLQGYNPTL